MLVLVLCLVATACGQTTSDFVDNFYTNNTELWQWRQSDGFATATSNAIALPRQLELNASMPNATCERGLIVTMSSKACLPDPTACCRGSHCATVATGFLRSSAGYNTGELSLWSAIAHGKGAGRNSTKTCFGAESTSDSAWLCFQEPGYVNASYTAGGASHEQSYALGFDQSAEYHLYSIRRDPASISFLVDLVPVWTILANATRIPAGDLQIVFSLQPLLADWQGEVTADVGFIRFNSQPDNTLPKGLHC